MTFEWADPPDYLEALAVFLSPLRQTVFWNPCWHNHTDLQHFSSVVDHLRRHTAIEGAAILDTGCGTAGLLIALRKMGAAELVGIELDANIFRLAVTRTRTIPSIQIIQADAQIAALARQRFDIVISHHVIEHVTHPERYMQTLRQLMKPGAILFIECPNRMWPIEAHSNLPLIHYLPRPISKNIGRCLESTAIFPGHVRDRGRTSVLYETDFTYFSLKRLLKRNGFQILEFNNPRGVTAAPPVCRLAHLVDRFPLYIQDWFARLFSKVLYAVCRGPSDSTIPDGLEGTVRSTAGAERPL